MADEPTSSDWLPPRAPGGEPPPRFEPAPPEPEPEPEPAVPRARPVQQRSTQSNGLAVTALVLGIIGLTLLVITLGLAFVFTLPCSIAAWIFSAQARARIAVGETAAGRGQAHAAYILGVLGVVLGVMAMVGWIVAIASGLDLDQLRQDLEDQSNSDAVVAVRALIAR